MKIGVISDTHDNVPAVEAAVETFESRGVETVVHCGDFIAPPVIPFFEGLRLHGVLGNNDGELDGLGRTFRTQERATLHGRFADLELGGARFAVLHGEDRAEVEAIAESGEYDYVCYGHHHVAEVREVGETTVLNPGAHFPTVAEEHRSVAIVDTDADEVELVGIT